MGRTIPATGLPSGFLNQRTKDRRTCGRQASSANRGVVFARANNVAGRMQTTVSTGTCHRFLSPFPSTLPILRRLCL